jgi:hypothetical protein
MEISALSSVPAYYPAETTPRRETRAERPEAAALESATAQTRAQPEQTKSPIEAEKARQAEARKDPTGETASQSGIQFEYQDQRQVMKLYNSKGVLIYQVPSEGRLTLIEADDAAASRPSIEISA